MPLPAGLVFLNPPAITDAIGSTGAGVAVKFLQPTSPQGKSTDLRAVGEGAAMRWDAGARRWLVPICPLLSFLTTSPRIPSPYAGTVSTRAWSFSLFDQTGASTLISKQRFVPASGQGIVASPFVAALPLVAVANSGGMFVMTVTATLGAVESTSQQSVVILLGKPRAPATVDPSGDSTGPLTIKVTMPQTVSFTVGGVNQQTAAAQPQRFRVVVRCVGRPCKGAMHWRRVSAAMHMQPEEHSMGWLPLRACRPDTPPPPRPCLVCSHAPGVTFTEILTPVGGTGTPANPFSLSFPAKHQFATQRKVGQGVCAWAWRRQLRLGTVQSCASTAASSHEGNCQNFILLPCPAGPGGLREQRQWLLGHLCLVE